MKKVKILLLLASMSLLLTGCVKYNAQMEIKKDKSMDLSVIYAVDTTYFGETGAVDEEQKAQLEKAGFKFSEYAEGSMKGYTITKEYKNIEDILSCHTF